MNFSGITFCGGTEAHPPDAATRPGVRDETLMPRSLYKRNEAGRIQTGAGFAGSQCSDIQSLHKNRLHFPAGGV